MCPTSPMPTTSHYSAVATARFKACLKLLIATPLQLASKTKVMSVLSPGEQRQALLLDGEPLEDVDKFKYLGSIIVATARTPKR